MRKFYHTHSGGRGILAALLALFFLLPAIAMAQTPHRMAEGNYTENFATISEWAPDFASGTGAAPFSKAAPSPALPSQNNVFATGSSGGVQRLNESIVLLATGSTDGQNAAAFDLSLDFTDAKAGTITVDWASVNNSTGNRQATFSIQANIGTDGSFVEVPGSAVTIINNDPTNGTLETIALPAALNGQADAKLRFYLVTTGGGTTGSRPKMSLGSITVTGEASGTTPTEPPVTEPPVTEPTLSLSLNTLPDFGNVAAGAVSAARSFTVNGQRLTGDITITPAPGFEIRTGRQDFACCAITLRAEEGTIDGTVIEVRFAPGAAQAYAGNLEITGGGAATQQVAVTGTGVEPVFPATLSTTTVTEVTTNSAVAGGDITSDGGSAILARGLVWATTVNPTIDNSKTTEGTETGAFTSQITGLVHSTVYYVRAYATNATGTAYGQERTFTTTAVQLAAEPTTSSAIAISEVTSTSLKLTFSGGNGTKRLVLARLGEAVDATPEDGATYTANAAFRQGQEISAGNFAVFNGTGDEVTVTGLRGSGVYHFAVFDYNDNDTEAAENYLTAEAGIASATTPIAPPALVFEENFDYPASSMLSDNGWAIHSGGVTSAIPVAEQGLTFEGYPSSGIGNSAVLLGNGQDLNRTFDAINPGTPVYTAFLVNIATAKSGGDYFLHLGPSSMGTTFRNRVYVRASGNGKFHFGVSGSGATQEYTTTEYDLNTTYLLVTKYEFDETGNTTTLYVNPTATEPTTAQASITETSVSPSDIGSVALRQGSSTPVITVDGIRIATSYALAVGAPAAKETQEITFSPLAGITFGAAPFELTASSSSELPVSFSVVSGPATLSGNTLTLTGAGEVLIKASQAGDAAFEPATDVEQAFCVNPATPVLAATGMNLRVTNPTEGVTTYAWFLNGTPVEGATGADFTATEPGSYTVVASAGDCASATSEAFAITPTGIKDELLTKGVAVYPVPASDRLRVQADETGEGEATLALYDLSGRQVLTQRIRTFGTLDVVLEVASLQRGPYVLLVSTPKGFISRKIILN